MLYPLLASIGMSSIDLACCAGCLGTVGVRGDVLALKWDGVYVDGACVDGVYLNGVYIDRACSCLLLEFP